MEIDDYLARIGFDGPLRVDLDTLDRLMRANLSAVPFENIDVFNGTRVRTDVDWSFAKVVEHGRGGWCFELNGVFAEVLESLGFRVARLGAAVLLGGPASLVDHVALEVRLDEPYLVDVGFGDSFCRPLALNRRGPQDGGTGTFELLPSREGLTLTRHDAAGIPEPQYRFKRVSLTMADFDGASARLQDDPDAIWHQRAFASRYLDGGPDRVTLVGNRLKIERGGNVDERPIEDADWSATLEEWFSMGVELGGSADRRRP